MAQLGFLEKYFADASGTALAGLTVEVRKQGALANGTSGGGNSTAFVPHHPGAIVTGDSTVIETGTSAQSATVDSKTSITLAGVGHTWTDGQRLSPTTNLPTLYSDGEGVDSVANATTTDARGKIGVYLPGGFYDLRVSGTGYTTTLIKDLYVPSEHVKSHIYTGASESAFIIDTIRDITTEGAKLLSIRNNGVEKLSVDKDGAFSELKTQKMASVRYADEFDSATSTTDGIQEAHDDLPAGGGKIYCSAKSYNLDSVTVTISKDDVVLEGSGWGTVITTDDATGFNLITVTGDRCHIRNLKVLSARTKTDGAGIASTGDDTSIFNVMVQDTPDRCISFNNNTRGLVDSCRLIDPGDSGAVSAEAVLFSTSTYGRVINTVCDATNTGVATGAGHGQIFFFSASDNGSAIGNNLNNTENGIRCVSDNCRIVGNQITSSETEGIRVTGDDITVSANTCLANGGSGIRSNGGNRINISGNVCQGNTNKGIQIADTTEAINDLMIANNTCHGNGGDGVQLSTSTTAVGQAVIKNNLCSGEGGNGVTVTASGAATLTDVVIDGNVAVGSTSDGINIVGASATFVRAVVKDNVANNNGSDGIFVGACGAASSIYVNGNEALGNTTTQHNLTPSNWTYSGFGQKNNDIASAATITVAGDGLYNITGTTNITAITAAPYGTKIILRFAAFPTPGDLIHGNNIVLANNDHFNPVTDDCITLVSNGTNWYEDGRHSTFTVSAQSYTATHSTDRVLNSPADTLEQVGDVLGTLIADLQAIGLIQ